MKLLALLDFLDHVVENICDGRLFAHGSVGLAQHRGACGGDGVSGDGAGVMTAVPWELFEAEGMLKGNAPEQCGVAMYFLPQDAGERAQAEKFLEEQAKDQALEDAMDYLDEALGAKKIELEPYLEFIRELSKEQFFARATTMVTRKAQRARGRSQGVTF